MEESTEEGRACTELKEGVRWCVGGGDMGGSGCMVVVEWLVIVVSEERGG